MVRAAPIQTEFTAGELSPFLEGRIDIDKYGAGASLIENLICLKQGPLVRRGGFKYVAGVKDSSDETVLIPFRFSIGDNYQIEAGDTYFRFYKDRAQIMDGGSPYEAVSPYASTDLLDSDLRPQYQFTQSADVLFITHGSYEIRTLGRVSDTDWTVSTIDLVDGPYLPENATDTTFTLSGTTGSVTVTASAVAGINGGSGFQSTDVGRLIRWKDVANDWTWLEITAYTSTTEVTATIKGEDASATTATNDWRLGVYSDTTGWPTVCGFFQDRLVLAGSSSYPDRYDLSRTGGYSDTELQFAPSDADGTVTDDAAITGTLQSGQINQIQWVSQDERGLVIGTTGADWIVRPDTANGVLTPSNSKADKIASIGSASVAPINAESGTLYIQRAGRKIYDVIYNFDRDQLKPRDVSIASDHITLTGISEMAFQQEPANVAWMRRFDGKLIGLTYYPDEQIFAPHGHVIGGTDVKVRSISVIPDPDGERDEVWAIVERTINGATVKYVEYMTRFFESDMAKADAVHVDSALVYDGVATGTITGLDHLEGETVKVMVDGKSHPDLTVSSGSVTLANDVTGSKVAIGLGNTWKFNSLRPEGAGARDGTSQGKVKRITGIVVRLLNTLGLRYGPDENNTDEYEFEQGAEYGEDLALYTGDTPFLRGPFSYEQDGRVYMEHDGVFPACILAIMPDIVTQDRG